MYHSTRRRLLVEGQLFGAVESVGLGADGYFTEAGCGTALCGAVLRLCGAATAWHTACAAFCRVGAAC